MKKENKSPNKFQALIKSLFMDKNIGILFLAIITAIAYTISSI